MARSAAPAGEEAAALTVRHKGLLTFGMILATALQSVDATIANVALPHMQGGLGAARDTITWVLTSYIVAMAITTPLTGWLAARFGVRRVVLVAIAGFTGVSALCGLATTLPQMVAFRIAQGAFGATLVPLTQAVLLDLNPRGRQGSAMALWAIAMTGIQAMGPTLGGWLTENYSWRWVFLINVPLGTLAFMLILSFLDRELPSHRRPFDFLGFAALAVSVGAFQLMLDRGERKDWFNSQEIVLYAVIAGLGMWTFLVHSFTTRHAFFTPRLFRDRNFALASVLMAAVFMVFMGSMSLTPSMMQQLYNYPVMTAAILMMPRSLSMLISMLVLGRLMSRIDARIFLVVGLTLLSASLWWMSGFSLQMDSKPLVWSAFLQGFGIACIFLPMNVTAFATLPPELRAEATALAAMVRNIAQSLGVSVVTALLSVNTQKVHASLASHITSLMDLVALPGNLRFLASPGGMVASLNASITREASMVAYVDDYYLMFWMCICLIPLVLLLRPPPSVPDPSQAAVVD